MNIVFDKLSDYHMELVHWYYRNLYRKLRFKKFCIGVAYWYLAIQCFKMSRFALSLIPNRQQSLAQKYGPKSWALVTGGSDGIGKQYCLQLAEEGFNIAILARNPEKMEDVCKQCRLKGVETKSIQVDFAQVNDSVFYEQLLVQLQELDISILVNNVGMAIFDSVDALTINDQIAMFRVNALSTLLMSKIAFDLFRKRPQRSVIITTSSGAARVSPPYLCHYTATKSFQSYLMHSLRMTYDNLDYLVVYPLGVTTKMIYNLDAAGTVTAEECVKGALNDLRQGKCRTAGDYKHEKMTLSIMRSCNRDAEAIALAKGIMNYGKMIQQQGNEQKQ